MINWLKECLYEYPYTGDVTVTNTFNAGLRGRKTVKTPYGDGSMMMSTNLIDPKITIGAGLWLGIGADIELRVNLSRVKDLLLNTK